METLVQMVISTPEDTDEKTRFKYVYIVYIICYVVYHFWLLLMLIIDSLVNNAHSLR